MSFNLERPVNDVNTIRSYAPGSTDRRRLEEELTAMRKAPLEIPLIIGGHEVRTGTVLEVPCPDDTGVVLARAHLAGPDELRRAVESALSARADGRNQERLLYR